jgi:hypothetical protein
MCGVVPYAWNHACDLAVRPAQFGSRARCRRPPRQGHRRRLGLQEEDDEDQLDVKN